jgi:Glyoxalase/Bleomycin resistance protein/Dioxygenase superfamily
MFKIKSVHHLGLPVNDLDRAKKFYTEVLGMACAKVDVDIETGGLYKEAMGNYPLTARLFMENGAELVLFQRPKPLSEETLTTVLPIFPWSCPKRISQLRWLISRRPVSKSCTRSMSGNLEDRCTFSTPRGTTYRFIRRSEMKLKAYLAFSCAAVFPSWWVSGFPHRDA